MDFSSGLPWYPQKTQDCLWLSCGMCRVVVSLLLAPDPEAVDTSLRLPSVQAGGGHTS